MGDAEQALEARFFVAFFFFFFLNLSAQALNLYSSSNKVDAKSARVGNPIRAALTQECPTAAPRGRVGTTETGTNWPASARARASFKTWQHAGRRRLRINLGRLGDEARRCCWKEGELDSISAPTAAKLRGPPM